MKPDKNHILIIKISLLVVVILIAAGLRFWGIDFGLPYEYHVDEVQYVRQAASMGRDGFEPKWWNNPPFYKYVYFTEFAVFFVVGKLLGLFTSASDFGARLTLDPTWLYLIGRSTTALLGTLTVLVVYWLGRAAYSYQVGLLGAWFLAVSFIHVRDSHYAVNDIPAVFLMTLAVLAAVKIQRSAPLRWYLFAGIAVGSGFAVKYTVIFSFLPILVAHLLSPDVTLRPKPRLQLQRLLVMFLAAGLSAVLASPYFVIKPGNVIRDIYESLYLPGQLGFDGWLLDPVGGYLYYIKTLFWGLGWLLSVLVIAGLLFALIRHKPVDLIIATLPIVIYIYMGSQQMYFARFILPVIPFLLILAAMLLYKIVSGFTNSRLGISLGLILGAFLFAFQPSISSVRSDYLLTQIDTRTIAKQWIEAAIPEGAKIALDWPFYGPPLSSIDKQMPDSIREYDVTIVGGAGLSDRSIEWYKQNEFDYLITSSFISDIPLASNEQDMVRKEFYASLSDYLRLVIEFSPMKENHEAPFLFDELYGPVINLWNRDNPGPILRIYQFDY